MQGLQTTSLFLGVVQGIGQTIGLGSISASMRLDVNDFRLPFEHWKKQNAMNGGSTRGLHDESKLNSQSIIYFTNKAHVYGS